VEALANGRPAMSLEELRRSYSGWQISVEQALEAGDSFVARKELA
jgi:hypothetical protein